MSESGISVVMATRNRLPRLRESLSAITKSLIRVFNTEIIVWDNDSSDGTKEYLQGYEKFLNDLPGGLVNCSLKVVYHDKNVGLSAINKAMKMTNPKHYYLVKMDDDVVEIPNCWHCKLKEVFDKIPEAGFIASWHKNDDKLPQDGIFKRIKDEDHYKHKTIKDIPLAIGDAAGGLVMTTRDVYDKVGGFVEMDKEGIFYFSEDFDYSAKCRNHGLIAGFRMDMQVHHLFGWEYNKEFKRLTIEKFTNWLCQKGFKDKTDEERVDLLRLMSMDDEIIPDIIENYHKENG